MKFFALIRADIIDQLERILPVEQWLWVVLIIIALVSIRRMLSDRSEKKSPAPDILDTMHEKESSSSTPDEEVGEQPESVTKRHRKKPFFRIETIEDEDDLIENKDKD